MKRLAILFLLFILVFPIPAKAQSPEPYIDPCDQLPLRDWPKSRDVLVQNGVCVLQKASLGTDDSLKDFILRFKMLLEPNGQLGFGYSTGMNDTYSFTITPTEAKLMNYIRFGNASSTVLDNQLAKATLEITAGNWVEVEIGMQAHRQWLVVDGKTVIDRKTARFSVSGFGGTGVYLDDIQLIRSDLSINGEQLPGYPPGLGKTWIAFLNDHLELALVHPDGTGLQILAVPLVESYPVWASFSPDGKMLLVNRGDGEQTLLTFYSMEAFQFVGSEIRLPSAPLYDWTPDGQHLVVLRDQRSGNVTLEKINIQTGQVAAAYTLPAIVDEQAVQIRSVSGLDCSPAAEIVTLEVAANLSGQDVRKAILFDLSSQQAHFLPGAQPAFWSPGGSALFSRAGGLIDLQSLAFIELSGEMVKRITNYENFIWSPNGQFVYSGKENAGNEEYAVYILDLDRQKVITLPLIGFGSFAPDNRHFVFGDSGRVIIRSLFEDAELQVAEGSNPIWQPAPGMYPAEPVYPAQPTATAPNLESPGQETPFAESTVAPPSAGAQEVAPPEDGSPAQAASRPSWPFALFALSLVGLALTGGFAYLRYFRSCPSCRKRNRGTDPFCMYCGSRLTPPARLGTVLVVLAMLAGSGCLVIGGATGLLMRPKQNPVVSIGATVVPDAVQPEELRSTPTENKPRAAAGYPCGKLDLARVDLLELIRESELSEAAIAQFFTQAGKITPAGNQTAEAVQAETLMTQYGDLVKSACPILFLSISPDRQYILVSGNNFTDGSGNGYWAALYDRKTYRLIWAQPVKITPSQFVEMVWSPAGDSFAVSSNDLGDEGGIAIYATGSGSLISRTPASTREGAYCLPMEMDKNQFRWLPDGKRLVRKIANAVQVLDAATGEVISEIAFDDSLMGSPHAPPDDNRCFFVFTWSSDGSRLATLGASLAVSDHPAYNRLKIWDAASGKLLAENKQGIRYPSRISFSPDGTKLLLTGYSPMIVEAKTGQILQQLTACPVCSSPGDILWTADSRQVLLREDNNFGLYDLSLQSWQTLSLPDYRGNARAWLDDRGHVLMIGSGAPTVVSILSGEEISLLEYFKSSQ